MRNFILSLLFISSFSLRGGGEDNEEFKRTHSYTNLSQILDYPPCIEEDNKLPQTKKKHEANKDQTDSKARLENEIIKAAQRSLEKNEHIHGRKPASFTEYYITRVNRLWKETHSHLENAFLYAQYLGLDRDWVMEEFSKRYRETSTQKTSLSNHKKKSSKSF